MRRVAVYTDDQYWRLDGRIYSDQAFALFLIRLGRFLDGLVIMGKLNPRPGKSHYELPGEVGFVELPYYASLARPVRVLWTMSRAIAVCWRELGEVDGVLLFGPHPLALAFACLAAVRRKSIALGVRQDFPHYVRARHPGRRWIHAAGDVLDTGWRLLARHVPVLAVGPVQAAVYAGDRTLELTVSLVDEQDIADERKLRRAYDGPELQMLSVGRLEEEKNPLLLADILELARRQDQRWRLVVCGEGPLEEDLRDRLAEFGLSDYATLRGYVTRRELREVYLESHSLVHVSWTEGLPQVLFEAFAARLPVVATAVGGIAAAAGDATLLIPPGDAAAASEALARVAGDAELRARLTAAGAQRVSARTLDAGARNVATFLSSGGADRPSADRPSAASPSADRGSSLDERIEAGTLYLHPLPRHREPDSPERS